jgi:hypothetical protein
VDTFNNFRGKFAKKSRINIQDAWIEPMLWCLHNMEWTNKMNPDADTVQKRHTTCTFLELACAIDILTGGRCGPKGASFHEKTEICKKIWTIAAVHFKFKARIELADSLPAAAPLGYDGMPGVTRRPNFGKWPGLTRAIATTIRFAKKSEDGLMTKMPRVQWFKPKWEASVMGEIMEQLENRRRQLQSHEICPDMRQRTLRLSTQRAECKKDTGIGTDNGNAPSGGAQAQCQTVIAQMDSGQVSEHERAGGPLGNANQDETTKDIWSKGRKRIGPCHFGCTQTTNVRNGVQIWKAPPSPSPWPGIGSGASLCNRCYSKGIALRRRQNAERAMQASLDASDERMRLVREGGGAKRARVGTVKENDGEREVEGTSHNANARTMDAASATVEVDESVKDGDTDATTPQREYKRHRTAFDAKLSADNELRRKTPRWTGTHPNGTSHYGDNNSGRPPDIAA